jgi:hypothetical protein
MSMDATNKSQGRQPFFARLLEAQELEQVAGGSIETKKFPSDNDEFVTLKYPSDADEDCYRK